MEEKQLIEDFIKLNPKLSRWWKYQHIWIYLSALLGLVFVVFYPSLEGQFIKTWDDYGYAVTNPYIDQLSLEGIKGMFTNPLFGAYNPLTTLTFAVEKHFFGTNPFVHHFNNVLLHLLNTILVFWLSIKLRVKLEGAILVSALFAIHPMHVESVAWITERKDVLFGAFYLGALISYIHYFKHQKASYLILSLFLMLLSSFSKIQAVALPLSMVMIDYYFRRKLHWRLIVEKIPFFFVSLVFGLIGIAFLKTAGAFNVTSNIQWYERPLMGAYALGTYLYKTLIPYPLSAFYPYPQKVGDSFPMIYYIVPALVATFGLLAAFTYKWTRIVVFGVGFFFFNIVFLLQVVEAGAGFIADRFSYIAYLGLFFIIAQGFSYLLYKKPQWKSALMILMAVYLLGLGASSFDRCKAWHNDATLWNAALEKYPNISFAYLHNAQYYTENQQYEKAITNYEGYITVRPYNKKGFYERGRLYLYLKKYEKAITDFNDVLKISSKDAKALKYKGMAQAELKQYEGAIKTYNRLLKHKKDNADAYLQRAIVYEKLQNFEAAIADYSKAIELKPEDVNTLLNRGGIYFQQKKFDLALSDINKVLSTQPQTPKALLNRAIIYASTNRQEAAIKDFDAYLKSNPADANAYNWRGISKTQTGDNQGAIKDFSKAIQSKPSAEYYQNRANAYLQIGEKAKAAKDLKKVK